MPNLVLMLLLMLIVEFGLDLDVEFDSYINVGVGFDVVDCGIVVCFFV